MTDEHNSFPLWLRRISFEDTYVSVPITAAIMTQKEDGTMEVDLGKLMTEATRLGQAPDIQWTKAENETYITVNPIPKPESEE